MTRRTLWRNESGAAAIEFGLIGLLLFAGTIGLFEVGRAFFISNELSYAADRAARSVMLNFGISEDDLETAVRNADVLTALVPEDITVTSPAPAANANFRSVQLTYTFTPIVAGFTLGTVPLTAQRQVAR